MLPFCVFHRLTWALRDKLSLWNESARARALFERVGSEVRCYGRVWRMGTGRVRLGRQGRIYDGVLLETQRDGFIEIGDDFVLNRGVLIAAFAGITLGAHVMIGEHTSLRDQDHKKDEPGTPIARQGHVARQIVVEDDVWIGRGCAILAGVRIGKGAVVGANSVVTGDVAAGTIVAGAPAREIGRR